MHGNFLAPGLYLWAWPRMILGQQISQHSAIHLLGLYKLLYIMLRINPLYSVYYTVYSNYISYLTFMNSSFSAVSIFGDHFEACRSMPFCDALVVVDPGARCLLKEVCAELCASGRHSDVGEVLWGESALHLCVNGGRPCKWQFLMRKMRINRETWISHEFSG